MISRSRLLTLLLTLVLLPHPATAAAPAADPDAVGPLVLRDESLDQVLALLERWTGKTVLRPQVLPTATLTLSLPGGLPRAEAVCALETLLTLNGLALVPSGDRFLKVTPLAGARAEAPELIDGPTLALPTGGRVVSKLFQLQFLRVAEVMPQITPLLGPGTENPAVVFEKANAALVTAPLSTVQHVEALLARIDQPVLAGLEPRFYPLHFAKASDVVARMHAILSGPLEAQVGSATTYTPDDRTNQVILVSDPRQRPFFDELVARLDVKSDPNTRNDVIYLKHAAAKEVATTLSQLVAGQNAAASAAQPDAGRSSRPRTGATPAAAPATPGPAAAAPATSALAPEAANQFSALLTILPEERSNSLIVSGTVDDIRLINELVAKIDILLAQVRIEVVIAEVSLQDKASSGISALGLKIVDNRLVGFSGEAAGLKVDNGVLTAGDRDLSAVISLATTPRRNDTTILSQPNIITTHNKEGKIFVGESVPVISSYLSEASATGGTGAGYRSTVSAQDIGIELSVVPLIGTDGSVQLEVKQQVNDILGDVIIDGNPQPRVGKRSTASFVTARSGEIIVLGGLQRTTKTRSTSRLGPVPVLGDLLGARNRENTRTDLVFFLRPTVLTNSPADNRPALQQLDRFPAADRTAVKAAIEPAP